MFVSCKMAEEIPLMKNCSVGELLSLPCHCLGHTNKVGLTNVDNLSPYDLNLLILRTEQKKEDLVDICEHHKKVFLLKYEGIQKFCYDPFSKHKKRVTQPSILRSVSVEYAATINSLDSISTTIKRAIPGKKICDNCRRTLHEKLQENQENSSSQSSAAMETDSSQSVGSQQIEAAIARQGDAQSDVNSVLQQLNQSPLKLHAVNSHRRHLVAKRKYDSACSVLRDKMNEAVGDSIGSEAVDRQQKAADLDDLIVSMKTKLDTTVSRREKIQLLTLVPDSWAIEKTMAEFEVSKYTAYQAKLLKRDSGILTLPRPRTGRKLEDKTVKLVEEHYQNDENSRILPGQKDRVSVKKNVYEQKRLLLANLNELYAGFKFEHPEVKVGFSKFCSLRPKWCVLAGSSGTHSVCVCIYHENVSLLLQACAFEQKYSDLFDLMVCSKDSRDCMFRICPNCPQPELLEEFLISQFEDWDPDDEVTYRMWVSTDRTQQVTATVSCQEYIKELVQSLQILLPHSFITKAQSEHLKQLKANLSEREAVVLFDFSENYEFVIQNEAQGYHWCREGCTLHPAVIYIKLGETVKVFSLCILSDDMEHDVPFVYETQRIAVQFINERSSVVRHVNYFTDGCGAQYKNCKSFINLCHHQEDFNLTASWSFFATAHGKSPCDGIGGAVKRLLRKASLQKDATNTINSVVKVFNFCQHNIENIQFFLVEKEKLIETRRQLQDRFALAKTVPGTRSQHHFIPLSTTSIGAKRISRDKTFNFTFNFLPQHDLPSLEMCELSINSYVACRYEDRWYFALILSKEKQEGDILVKFMHPNGPAPSFFWPQGREDSCLVPIFNVISIVKPPFTKGSGRVYYFEEKEVAFVEQEFSKRFK